MNRETLAVFDFDGTLTKKETFVPFIFYVLGPWEFLLKGIFLLGPLLLYAMGCLSNDVLKEKTLKCYFRGYCFKEFQKKAHYFSKKKLSFYLKKGAKKRIEWHQKKGHRCILLSANLETLLLPWAQEMGFSYTLATRLCVDERGCLKGTIEGKNCWGLEKVLRLEKVIGARGNYEIYAYGNSRGDKELLDYADFSFYRELS